MLKTYNKDIGSSLRKILKYMEIYPVIIFSFSAVNYSCNKSFILVVRVGSKCTFVFPLLVHKKKYVNMSKSYECFTSNVTLIKIHTKFYS